MGIGRFLKKLDSAPAANDQSENVRAGDPRIRRALDALSNRPSEKWTVAKLAKVAGLSRAAFARRFVDEVGIPPLRHLASIRIRRASELLKESDDCLAAIAIEVGYANEFALSRAFRRLMHEPPSIYRRQARFASPIRAITCRAA